MNLQNTSKNASDEEGLDQKPERDNSFLENPLLKSEV